MDVRYFEDFNGTLYVIGPEEVTEHPSTGAEKTPILGIPITRTPDANDHPEPAGTSPCAVCGRPVKLANNPKFLRMTTAWEAVPHDAPLPDDEDMGGFPIGADCLRRHPELKPLAK